MASKSNASQRSSDGRIVRSLRATIKVARKDGDGATDNPAGKLDPELPVTIQGIANAAITDRVGEMLAPDGMIINEHSTSVPILLNHDYGKLVGETLEVNKETDGITFTAEIGRPKLAPLTADQIIARSLVAQGMLKTVSVGFLPLEFTHAEYDERGAMIKPLVYTKWELLEISLVSVPCNAGSLISMKELTNMSRKKIADLVKQINKDASDGTSGGGDTGASEDLLPKIAEMLGQVSTKLDSLQDQVNKLTSDKESEDDTEGKEGDKPDADKDENEKRLKNIETLLIEIKEHQGVVDVVVADLHSKIHPQAN